MPHGLYINNILHRWSPIFGRVNLSDDLRADLWHFKQKIKRLQSVVYW